MNIVFNHEYPRRLKAAFIGCGNHAFRNVYPTFQFAPVELVAVCDLDQARADAFAAQFGARRAYSDYQEMIAEERPEVVFIVTNYDEQGQPRYPQLAEACMRAGAHVWIEKPPASSAAQVLSMMEVSRATGKQVGVGFKKMFFPANRKVKEIIGRPEFGGVTSITARYPQALPPLAERSSTFKMRGFLDHMVHPHSLLRLLGGDLEWIFVNRHEDTGAAVVSMRFTSGAVGNLHFAQGQSGMSEFERTEIVGEGANVVIENNIRVRYYRRGRQSGSYGRGDSYFGPDEHAPLLWEPEFSLGQLHNKGLFLLGYAPEIVHFTTRLLDDKPPEWGTLYDALEILRVYEAYLRPDGIIQPVSP